MYSSDKQAEKEGEGRKRRKRKRVQKNISIIEQCSQKETCRGRSTDSVCEGEALYNNNNGKSRQQPATVHTTLWAGLAQTQRNDGRKEWKLVQYPEMVEWLRYITCLPLPFPSPSQPILNIGFEKHTQKKEKTKTIKALSNARVDLVRHVLCFEEGNESQLNTSCSPTGLMLSLLKRKRFWRILKTIMIKTETKVHCES